MADENEERRLSPDSSTQILPQRKHKHKRKKKSKHKSKRRKKKSFNAELSEDETCSSHESSNSSTGSVSGRGDKHTLNTELVLDIKPLTDYVDDRKELNSQLFKIMERKEMKKIMPKSVKKLGMDELKCRCLDQLEVISKKRLLKVIDGQEMSSSSSESEHGETSKKCTIIKNKEENVSVISHTQPITVEKHVQNESVNILEELSLVPDQDEIDELIKGTTKTKEPSVETANQESPAESEIDTESQLLELEYRARALKSMVQVQERL